MIPRLDSSKSIVVPVGSTKDLARVGPTANHFADLFDCPIELVSVLHPDDDFGYEFGLLATATANYSQSIGKTVELHVVSDVDKYGALVRLCTDHLVCMATSATPFSNDHYVGSHAATLVGQSRAPVILVGPCVTEDGSDAQRVVVAVDDAAQSRAAMQAGRMLAHAMDSPIAKLSIAEKGVIYESDYHDSSSGIPEAVHATMSRKPIEHDRLGVALAERSEKSVLVVSTEAKQGLAWICEGSVAFDAVEGATGPVVAVGPNVDLDRFASGNLEIDELAWAETSRFVATPVPAA